jgi:hypothetical protein
MTYSFGGEANIRSAREGTAIGATGLGEAEGCNGKGAADEDKEGEQAPQKDGGWGRQAVTPSSHG